MNAADKQNLEAALMALTGLDMPLSNFGKRAPRAGELWTATAAQTNDATTKKSIKELAASVAQLAKNGKALQKDLSQFLMSATPKHLTAYSGTAQQYRDKVMAKRLASLKSFNLKGQRFVTDLSAMRDTKTKKFPGQGNVDVTVTVNSLNEVSEDYNQISLLFNKL